MGILLRRNKGILKFTNVGIIAFASLIVSISSASIDTIWAVFLKEIVISDLGVALFSSLLTIIAFCSYFAIIPLTEKLDKAKLYLLSLIFLIPVYFLLFLLSIKPIIIILIFILTFLVSIRITSYGLLIRDFSPKKKLSTTEGTVYSLRNSAWVIAPLLAGFLASKYGTKSIFLLATLCTLITFLIIKKSNIKDKVTKKKLDINPIKNFKEFFKNKDRTISYFLGSGVTTWWSLIYLFIPLYIIKQGLSISTIGFFLFSVGIPLIFFEYKFSKWASTKGFKKIFIFGYFFVAVISAICFFITNTYFLLSLLVFASIGIAMVEPTTEAYFFDILKGKEAYRFYAPYNTAIDSGLLIGKISGTILLYFLPLKYIFLSYSLIMFSFSILSLYTKNIIESKNN